MITSRSRSASIALKQRMCFCDVRTRTLVSKKDGSRGRRLYGCRNYGEFVRYCGYFEWLELPYNEDEAMSVMNNKIKELSSLIEKNTKLKDKLKNMKRETLNGRWRLIGLKRQIQN